RGGSGRPREVRSGIGLSPVVGPQSCVGLRQRRTVTERAWESNRNGGKRRSSGVLRENGTVLPGVSPRPGRIRVSLISPVCGGRDPACPHRRRSGDPQAPRSVRGGKAPAEEDDGDAV